MSTRRVLAGLAAAGLVVLTAGFAMPATASTKNKDKDAAVKAFKRVAAYFSVGQYDRAYERVHPAQKKVVTEECYVASVQRNFGGSSVEVQNVKEVYRTTVDILGTGTSAKGYGVTVDLKASRGGQSDTGTTTYYMVKVGGRWMIVLQQQVVDECASSASTGG